MDRNDHSVTQQIIEDKEGFSATDSGDNIGVYDHNAVAHYVL